MSKSLTAKRSNATHHLRLHLYTISVLEIGLTPTLPHILVSVNVSSVLYGRYELMSKSILVEVGLVSFTADW